MPYGLECRADDRDAAALAAARGFTLSEQRYACLEQLLAGGPALARNVPASAASSRLPPGFRLRELAGESEAGAYAELHRAVFGSQSMTCQFCVGWLDAACRTGHVEPLGVRPDCTGMGLAQALLAELSRRLAAAGAERVCVEADPANAAALRSYGAAGFRVTHTVGALGRILDPPDPAGRRRTALAEAS